MSDDNPATEPTPKAPRKPQKPKKRPHLKLVSPAPEPPAEGEFAGVTWDKCCIACTIERCVISTVNVCKHPRKTGDGGCGPITMANRAKVEKIIAHQAIDRQG